MRNTIKYAILAVAASVVLPFGAGAQDNLIDLSKKVTDFGNKTYKLTLETYAKGSSEHSTDAVPTDFVLVMDHSGSMSNNNVTTDMISIVSTGTTLRNDRTYKVVVDNKEYFLKRFTEDREYFESEDNPYSYADITATGAKTYYYKSPNDNNYYQVGGFTDEVFGTRRYYLTFTSSLGRRYIGKDGSVESVVVGRYGEFSTQTTTNKDWDITLYEHQTGSHYTYRYAETLDELTSATSGKEYVRTNGTYAVQATDEIYQVQSQKVTRLEAAKNAAEWFIREVYRNNPTKAGVDKHSLSIVWYGENIKPCTYQNGSYDLIPLSSIDVVNGFIKGIDATGTGSNTYCDKGLEQAYNTLYAARNDGHNKVVVFFTDGEPGSNSGYFAESTARDAMAHAVNLKSDVLTNNGNASKVYAIGLMDSGHATHHRTGTGTSGSDPDKWSSSTNIHDKYIFMNYVSSNYKVTIPNRYKFLEEISNAQCLDDITPHVNCTVDHGNEAPHGYFQASDGKNLGEIFKKIATDNATVNTRLTDETTVVLDAIKNCFTLPHPTSKENIQLYTCNVDVTASGTGNNVVWASDGTGGSVVYKDADNNVVPSTSDKIDHAEYWVPLPNKNDHISINSGPVTVSDPLASDIVEVTGYNYVQNYVGKVTTEGTVSWHAGQKLIIQIDIVADPANAGGVEQETNTGASGVYVPDPKNPGQYECLEEYEIPQVILPYVRIIRDGLKEGETALYSIVKVTGDGSSTPDTSDDAYTTNVMVSYGQNMYEKEDGKEYPSSVLKLLNTGWYKVTELPWAWANTIEHGITDSTTGIASTTNLADGAAYWIYFRNEPISDSDESFVEVFYKATPDTEAVEHAEANKNNNMGNTYPQTNN